MTSTSDWPFDDPENLASFTVSDIVTGAKPIRYVHHEINDGCWQFLTGDEVDMAQARLVCLSELVRIDPTVRQLADLPLGWRAERPTPADPWVRAPEFATDWDALVKDAYAYTESRQERLKSEFSLLAWERYDYDQARATLVFSNGGIPRLTTRIQIVGSTARMQGTWLWAWDNASILEEASESVHLLQKFGAQHGFDKLATAKWPADEVDGWEMVRVACLLLGGEGVYRAPDADGALFMVLSDPMLLEGDSA